MTKKEFKDLSSELVREFGVSGASKALVEGKNGGDLKDIPEEWINEVYDDLTKILEEEYNKNLELLTKNFGLDLRGIK